MVKVVRTECDSELSFKQNGNELTISMKLIGVPQVLVDRIMASEDLTMALVKTIMDSTKVKNLSQEEMEKLVESMEVVAPKESIH